MRDNLNEKIKKNPLLSYNRGKIKSYSSFLRIHVKSSIRNILKCEFLTTVNSLRLPRVRLPKEYSNIQEFKNIFFFLILKT